MNNRNYSLFDHLISNFDQILRTLNQPTFAATRPNPNQNIAESSLSTAERQHAAGLLRVDHVGEVCAQALYQGQALTAKSSLVKNKMSQSAAEETDHLTWCAQRLQELGSHRSYLNPAWYVASLLIGMIAGACGDRWSLGFVTETERQVVRHLDQHLALLPPQDQKSRVLLQQMRQDELHHANVAIMAGAQELPLFIKQLMRLLAKVMTSTAYYI